MGSKGKSDISNDAIRVFLQKVGEAYDTARGLRPFKPTRKQWKEVFLFFEKKCCYCNRRLKSVENATKDHLIPINKQSLGLHAWGNVVPCCERCDKQKHNQPWDTFLRSSAKTRYTNRRKRIQAFQRKYRYDPMLNIRTIATNLYEDVGKVAMTLVELRSNRQK